MNLIIHNLSAILFIYKDNYTGLYLKKIFEIIYAKNTLILTKYSK